MDDQESRIEFERISMLYANAPKIIAGNGLMTLFLAYILYDFMPLGDVLAWFLLALFLQFPRIILARFFKRDLDKEKVNDGNISAHEIYWVIATIPVSIALSGVVFFPAEGTQLVILILLITMLCAGNLLNSSASLKTVALDNGIIIVPAVFKLLFSPEPHLTTVGLFYMTLIVVFSSYALSLNHILVENIRYKINSESLSLFDPLTKLRNRRGMDIFIERLVPRAQRTGQAFGVMLIDIDHFKKYNDTYGHSAGDEALVNVAETLVHETRQDDFVVRYGGEEFMVILPDTKIEKLQQTAERICEAIRSGTDVTISAGLATYNEKTSFDEMVEKADKALYDAKEAGRDRFMIAS